MSYLILLYQYTEFSIRITNENYKKNYQKLTHNFDCFRSGLGLGLEIGFG